MLSSKMLSLPYSRHLHAKSALCVLLSLRQVSLPGSFSPPCCPAGEAGYIGWFEIKQLIKNGAKVGIFQSHRPLCLHAWVVCCH